MNIGNVRLSKLALANLIALGLVLIVFLIFPFWTNGYSWWNSCFFLFPGTVFDLIKSIPDYGEIIEYYGWSIVIGDVINLFLTLLCEIILVLGVRSLLILFRNKNQQGFLTSCKLTFIATMAIPVAFWVLEFVVGKLISFLTANSYYGFIDYSSIFHPAFGFYILILLGAGGFALPYIFKNENQLNPNINDLVNKGKEAIDKGVNVISGLQNENTGDLVPYVTLQANDQVANVTKLPATLGRDRNRVDTHIYDNSISREHAVISLYENYVVIKDVGSSLGTYINGDKITPNQDFYLYDGDNVRMGNKEFFVSVNQDMVDNFYQKSLYQQQNPYTGQYQSVEQEITVSQNQLEGNRIPINDNSPQGNNYDQQGFNSFKNEPKYDFVPETKTSAESIPENKSKQLENNKENQDFERTIFLGDTDFNKTMKLDYNGGSTKFPVMTLQSSLTDDIYLVNKTPYIIGTDYNQVDLKLDDQSISKKHLNIQRIDDQFYITDLNSTNGTKVNGQKLNPHQNYPINENDVITIGTQDYRFNKA